MAGFLTKLTLASVSFSAGRIKIVNTTTTNKQVQVFWWNMKGSSIGRDSLKERADAGVGIQNLEVDVVDGFASGASAAISGVSGAIDVPLAAFVISPIGGGASGPS